MPKVSHDAKNQQAIRNRIRRELGKRGLKQQALVDIWQISRTTASGKLNGRFPVSDKQIRQFEEAMGMRPGELEEGISEFEQPKETHESRANAIKEALSKAGKTQRDLAEIWGMNEASVSRKLAGQTAIKQRHIELLEEALHMKPGTILAGNGIVIGSTVNVEQKTTETDEGKIGATAFLEKFRQALSRDVVKALEKYASVLPTEQKTPSGWLTLCVALAPDETQNATK